MTDARAVRQRRDVPVVARCPVHGTFPSRAFNVTNSSHVSFAGNSESCPRCGRPSAVMDGTFDFDSSGFAQALAAPQWSRDALDEVQGAFETAADQANVPGLSSDQLDEIVDRLEKRLRPQAPELADEVKAKTKGKTRPDLVAILNGLARAVSGLHKLWTENPDAINQVGEILRSVFGG